MKRRQTARLQIIRALAVPLFPALAAILLPATAHADYLILDNGKRLDGLIRSETTTMVRIETPDGILLTLERSRIRHLEKEASAENLLLSGTLALREPDFMEATRRLTKALDAGSSPAEMRRAVIEMSPRFLDRMSYMSQTERGVWKEFCDRLTSDALLDGEWTHFRGEMALSMNDPAKALEWWRSLGADYYAMHGSHRERVLRWALRQLDEASAEQRFEEAVAYVELLNKLDSERGRGRRILLDLGMAYEARRAGNTAKACRIYAEEVMPDSPEVAKVCLRQTLEEQCRFLWERDKHAEALRVLREYGQPHLPDLAARLMGETYEQFIERTMARGRWNLARGLIAEAADYLEPIELERLREQALFGERREILAVDDYLAHYQLGVELQEKEFHTAAIESFALAAQSPQPELQEMARKRIGISREAEALEMLKAMTIKLDEYRYIEVLDFADRFRKRFPNSRYLDQANALARTAHLKMRNDDERKKELAAIRVDQAQRKLFLDEVDEALELIDTVLRDYPKAPAAVRAKQMKQEILRHRLTRGVGSLTPTEPRPGDLTTGSLPTLPGLDPRLLEELDEDAFKAEIQQIVKQLEL